MAKKSEQPHIFYLTPATERAILKNIKEGIVYDFYSTLPKSVAKSITKKAESKKIVDKIATDILSQLQGKEPVFAKKIIKRIEQSVVDLYVSKILDAIKGE
jgi:DNA phosphorothioation-dependent restriction protein DptG